MFYNINEQILVNRLPKNLIKSDGSIFINFYLKDENTLSDYGYYKVRNDNNTPPNLSYTEDVSKRTINIDKPYVDIVRTWINNSIPSHITMPINKDDSIDPEI